ncbi:MAG: vWA domain-containing protein [Solirubrobacterales bacterium]
MAAPAPMVAPMVVAPPGGARFPQAEANPWQVTEEHPVSTFSLDVDTASYAFVRRQLREGRKPPQDAVRVEEMVNYFPYDYPKPARADTPFRPTVTVMPSPWTVGNQLVHIGIKGYDIQRESRPRANLTFLIDVSGSMAPSDRLPLIQQSLHQLGDGLRPDDTVAIVTYAGRAGVALEPTKGAEVGKIMAAVDHLSAGGSTAGAEGIRTAYELAERMFDREAVNRVVLATDGDFNVGVVDPKQLERMIAEKRKSGIYLTILGVGQDNLNDALMQRLAQAGNGQAAYLDSLLEARKVWVEELGSTMFPIADDVKIQVEFNPAKVAGYRLVGYETRMLKRQDFNDDKVDAGEIGSGHTVTAIYEVVPAEGGKRLVEPLRYKPRAKPVAARAGEGSDELAFLRIRYKKPGQADSNLIEQPIPATVALPAVERAPADVRFSVAVAGFAQHLRGDTAVADWPLDKVADMAEAARGTDPFGWRSEFVQLVRAAKGLTR